MTSKKNLSAWLAYLNTLRLRSINLELGRVKQVARRLNIQPPSCPVITVAGTNGKGSVVGFLEAFYARAGYNVSAFTSPYLISFNEQFRINQQWISDEKLCEYFEKIAIARGDIPLTLFEFKTLAAFLFFSEKPLDLWILEVGLGGRLDAVNIMDPTVAVITSISLDHCDWLGDTRELIGREKAGILRAGKLAVCGDLSPPITIQEVAEKIGAKVFYRNKDFSIAEKENSWTWHGKNWVIENLPEPYLLKDNVATALMVIECLAPVFSKVMRDSHDLLRNTVASARVSGRLQIISHDPFVAIDVAHNEDSVRRLASFLRQQERKNAVAVFSVLKSKDLVTMAPIIAPYVAEWHIAELPHDQAMPLVEMNKVLQELPNTRVIQYASVIEAYHAAQKVDPQTLIVFGSFYVVSEVLTR